eukprot:4399536-Prymnesium_polylepis.2
MLALEQSEPLDQLRLASRVLLTELLQLLLEVRDRHVWCDGKVDHSTAAGGAYDAHGTSARATFGLRAARHNFVVVVIIAIIVECKLKAVVLEEPGAEPHPGEAGSGAHALRLQRRKNHPGQRAAARQCERHRTNLGANYARRRSNIL